jgi:hypothetical protein
MFHALSQEGKYFYHREVLQTKMSLVHGDVIVRLLVMPEKNKTIS